MSHRDAGNEADRHEDRGHKTWQAAAFSPLVIVVGLVVLGVIWYAFGR